MGKESVLITGSSRGLGRELARVFAENGYYVITHGKNRESILKSQLDLLSRYKLTTSGVSGDLKLEDTVNKLAMLAIENDISILINNAAVGMDETFSDISEERIKEILEVDMYAPILLTKKIYPLFEKKSSGTIVNIIGQGPLKDQQNQTIYRASKLGLKGFTDNLRYESKPKGIRVIGVLLGGMDTEMYRQTAGDSSKCINPKEVSDIIYYVTNAGKSCMVDEISIGRINYS